MATLIKEKHLIAMTCIFRGWFSIMMVRHAGVQADMIMEGQLRVLHFVQVTETGLTQTNRQKEQKFSSSMYRLLTEDMDKIRGMPFYPKGLN